MISKDFIKNLPDYPGVYFFIGKSGDIIYVGKAKSLKDRLGSYFVNSYNDIKVSEILRNSIIIKYFIADSEKEALLLEDKLIKKLSPKYNISLKDAKTYPFIKITKEDFPRIFLTRKYIKDGGKYFGPYPEVKSLKQFLKFYSDFLFIRKCRRKIDSNKKKKSKPCLYYYIKQCPAPCSGNISIEEYKKYVEKVSDFLSGGKKEYIKELNTKMGEASKNLNFEEAKKYRDALNCLKVNFDKILLRRLTDKDLEQILNIAVSAYDEKAEELKRVLSIKNPPYQIEGFDISNLGENFAVGSQVTFYNGIPLKTNYRRFKIKTVSMQNDFEMIKEIVYRCYKRRNEELKKMPDLILIDGGPVQVKFARKALEELNIKDLKVIGLAKQNEEVFDESGNKINLSNELLLVLKAVRDEAHRFAKSYHLKLRSK